MTIDPMTPAAEPESPNLECPHDRAGAEAERAFLARLDALETEVARLQKALANTPEGSIHPTITIRRRLASGDEQARGDPTCPICGAEMVPMTCLECFGMGRFEAEDDETEACDECGETGSYLECSALLHTQAQMDAHRARTTTEEPRP